MVGCITIVKYFDANREKSQIGFELLRSCLHVPVHFDVVVNVCECHVLDLGIVEVTSDPIRQTVAWVKGHEVVKRHPENILQIFVWVGVKHVHRKTRTYYFRNIN